MDQPPRLIENSAKNYLFETLQNCHHVRTNVYHYLFNFGFLLLFIGIIVLFLYTSYKNKLTPYEQQQKMLSDQRYILSKIKWYQEDRKNMQQSQMSSITSLPYIVT